MTDYRGKRLLFLGGFSMMCEPVEWAKSVGIHTIVTDYYKDSPAKRIADEAWDISTADIDELVERCKLSGVNGCFSAFDDFNIGKAAELSERLGLSYYATPSLVMETMDKAHFKSNLQQYGVPSTREYTYEECLRNDCFPVIVKPVDGSGSRGICVCRNVDQLDRAIGRALEASKSGRFLIEKYFEGDEVGINYVLQNGRLKMSAMHDRYLQKSDSYGPVKLPLAYVYPSKHQDVYLAGEDSIVRQAFVSMGLKNGSLFLQGCVQEGCVYFYEMGYRLNGAKQYQILERECGINPMHALINYALSGRMSTEDMVAKANPRFSHHYCTLSMLAHPGKIVRITGLERIVAELPNSEVTQWCKHGDVIPESARGTQKQIVTRVTLVATDLTELARQIDFVNDVYDVLDADGASMVVERFDTSCLQ